jgi:ribonucrease Y
MLFVVAGVVAVIAALSTLAMVAAAARRRVSAELDRARAQAEAEVAAARLEAAAARRSVENDARSESIARRSAALAEIATVGSSLERRAEAAARADSAVQADLDDLEQRAAAVEARSREVQSARDRASGLERDIERRAGQARQELEARALITTPRLVEQLQRAWVEDARADAAAIVRATDASAADPVHDREARRVLEIASNRYQNHFLTERNISTIRIGAPLVEALLADGGVVHKALEEVANVQLLVNDEHDAVRLDGLDGVGREVARRALAKLLKKPESIDEARTAPADWARKVRTHLEQEIRTLGKKAFQVLEIPKAHPEIVELVGALNYRTSYTQNQWLHAVEASFLCGMMAAELGLDEKLARRATLMHDIGKALTHKIEGSHAVIGADIARRLGESELVANAIGAHHADEPPSSVYAYLVAAADAMSGARPGARRELAEGFTARVEDLERIGASYRGVDHAHAVHGGRELRVYVREKDVDDLRVVEMSQDIAGRISDEMTFPGQIKVTVIRAFEAVATAS